MSTRSSIKHLTNCFVSRISDTLPLAQLLGHRMMQVRPSCAPLPRCTEWSHRLVGALRSLAFDGPGPWRSAATVGVGFIPKWNVFGFVGDKRRNVYDRQCARKHRAKEGRQAWESRGCQPLQSSAKAVIRFNTAGAVCMLGRMCHEASMYSHRDSRGLAVSTEPSSYICCCTHQTEKKQVGAKQDLAVTCASC